MGHQGYPTDDADVLKICRLLATTDISIRDIAKRFGVKPGTIASINRKHHIRTYAYDGHIHRQDWITNARHVH